MTSATHIAENAAEIPPPVSGAERIRILHSVGHLSRGGIETWLYQAITRMDPARFEHHILVLTDKEEPLTAAFRAAGISVLPCPGLSRPYRFRRNLSRILHEHGPFHAVHTHGFIMLTTQVLLFAWLHGVRNRIVQGHNDLRPKLAHASFVYKAYARASLVLSRYLATAGIACSEPAAEWTFGEQWYQRKPPVELLIGVDLEACLQRSDPGLRESLNIPLDRFIVVQIGRFTAAKNHAFTIRILAELIRRGCPVHLLLIGNGPLRPEVQQQAHDAGLADHCTWIADTDDVPKILVSIADLKLLPSLHEGLGLAAVEAQAADVPVLVSDTTPRECTLAEELIEFLPLASGPEAWADRVVARLGQLSHVPKREAAQRDRVLRSRFHIEHSVGQLTAIYSQLTLNAESRSSQ